MEKREPRKRGPRTSGDARQAIVSAARTLFMEHGVAQVSARRIAIIADVDPSLVRYYFSSMESLLDEALKVPDEFGEPFATLGECPLAERGEAFLTACLDLWEHPMGVTIVRWLTFASERDNVAYRRLIGVMTEGVTLALPEDIPPQEIPMRTALINTVSVGLGITRYVWKLEPLASVPREQLLASHGPIVQGYISDPLPF